MLSRTLFALLLVLLVLPFPAPAQNNEQLQVGPPTRRAEPPAPAASAEELEKRGDDLRADKDYLDAMDYYEAALRKSPSVSGLYNKIGISQLMLQRFKDARKSFERAIKADRKYADAYNNLGFVFYQAKNFNKAIKYYDQAILLKNDSAAFYNNLGAVYFDKKEFEKAALNYAKALELDPDIFERTSRAGVQVQLHSPEDQARYDYVLAKLYAKRGIADRSLHYLRKAMEEGYKDIGNVYKDSEFTELRKDPRFAQLMAAKPVAVPQ